MKYSKYLALFSFLVFIQCSKKAPVSGNIKLTSAEGWKAMVYLIQPRSLNEVAASFNGAIIDSAKIDANGDFAFEKMPEAPQPILLQMAVQKKGERFLNKLNNENIETANYFPFVWKNGQVMSIKADINTFQKSFSINEPIAENAAILALRDIKNKAYQEYLAGNSSTHHDAAQLLDEEAKHLNYQKALIAFAEKTNHFLPSMLALRWVSPQDDFERIPEFLFAQCKKWKNEPTHLAWAQQLCQKSDPKNLPILVGNTLPDFDLPMQSGETTGINQILGKELTILDLWASWCAPCRKENRNSLVPLWDKYHKDGFQIIGYALDGSKRAWERAIEKDGAHRWEHASHLKGDDAPLMEHLRLRTIPANLLLDKNGKVLAKNLHGDELMKFVKEYMTE
jgi:thiol-disulfide isomerase/thioredoxin